MNPLLVDGLDHFGVKKDILHFLVSKKIEGESEYDKKEGPLGDLREHELSDVSGIQDFLEQG